MLFRVRHELTPGTILWTRGVGAITVWPARDKPVSAKAAGVEQP